MLPILLDCTSPERVDKQAPKLDYDSKSRIVDIAAPFTEEVTHIRNGSKSYYTSAMLFYMVLTLSYMLFRLIGQIMLLQSEVICLHMLP